MTEELGQRALPSVVLVLAALLIMLVGRELAAALRDSWFDWSIRPLCYLDTAAPSLWVGLLMLWLFAVQLGWLQECAGARAARVAAAKR